MAVTATTATLHWADSSDVHGIAAYFLSRDGVVVATISGPVTQYTDIGLTPGTDYDYQVAAADPKGNTSAYSDVLTVTTAAVGPDTIPTNLVASAVTGDSLTLTWDPPIDTVGLVGYAVMRDGIEIATPTAATYSDSGLDDYTDYTYTVAARAGVRSDDSEPLIVRTLDTTAPTVPVGLAAPVVAARTVSLTWNPSSDNAGIVNYQIKQGSTVIGTSPVPSFQVSGLAEHTTYAFSVAAVDAAANASAFSAVLNVTTADVTPPTVPSIIGHLNLTGASVTIDWLAATDNVGVTSYVVRRNGVDIATVSHPTTVYDDTGLQESTVYTYAIAARDAAGNQSAFSPGHTVTTLDVTPPDAPRFLTATAITATGFTLGWSAPANPAGVTGYNVRRLLTGTLVGFTTGLSFPVTGLSEASSYTFYVTALDASSNESGPSQPLTVTTLDVTAPSVPTGLAASNITATDARLTWNPSTDNVGVHHYNVRRNLVLIGTAVGTTFDVTGLTESTSYNFSVQAVDAAGNASAHITLAVTTADETPPTPPTQLAASNITPSGLTLTWLPATDAVGVNGYAIYRDGILAGLSGTTTFADSGLAPDTSYTYAVVASDAAGNVSNPSVSLVARTAPSTATIPGAYPGGYAGGYGGSRPPADTTPPTVPTALHTTAVDASSAALAWTASTDNVGVSGYLIFRGQGAGLTQVGSSATTSYTDTGLSPGTSYNYVVKAIDAAGNISAASTVLSVTTDANIPFFYTPADLLPAGMPALVPNNTTVDNTASMQAILAQLVGRTVPAGRRKTLVFNVANRYNCEGSLALRAAGGNPLAEVDIIDMKIGAVLDDGHVADKYPVGSEDWYNHIRTREHLATEVGNDVRLIRYDVLGPFAAPKRRANNSPTTKYEAQHALNVKGTQNLYVEDMKTWQVWGDSLSVNPGTKVTANDTYPGGIEIFGANSYRCGRMHLTIFQVRAPDAIDPGNESANPGPTNGSVQDAPSASGAQYGLWYHSNATHPITWEACERNCIDLEPFGVYRHINDVTIGADSPALRSTFHVLGGLGTKSSLVGANAYSLLNRFVYHNILHETPLSFWLQGSPVAPGDDVTVTAASNNKTLPQAVINTTTIRSDALLGPTYPIHITGTSVDAFVHPTGKTATTWTGAPDGTGTMFTGDNVHFQYGAGRIKYTLQDLTVDNCIWNGVPEDSWFFAITRCQGLRITNNVAKYRAAHVPNLTNLDTIDCPSKVISGNTFTLG